MTTKPPFYMRERNPILAVSHAVASGGSGTAYTQGAWRTVVFNSEDKDDIGITLASNQIQGLPIGDYLLRVGEITNYGATGADFNIRLYDVTAAAEIANSRAAVQFASSKGNALQLHDVFFTLAAVSTIELQVYGTSNIGDSGIKIAEGSNEIFSRLVLERLA